MKYLFYTFFYSIGFLNLNAQNCLPDSIYRDSTTGVYPRPVSADYPNGGIPKKACINKPYSFTFTVVVPDSVIVPPLTTPIPLEKASIDTANAIINLPKGISYACNPPDCVFKKKTFGCLILQGTADKADTAGNYKPVIHMKLTVNLGFPIDYNIDYPGTNFPGEYILTLVAEKDCVSATNNQITATNVWFPNPNQGILHTTSSHIENVKIYNLNGKLIYSEKEIKNNGMELKQLNAEGIHIIHWVENNQAFVQKIIIQK